MHDYLSDVTIARQLELRCLTNKDAKNTDASSIEVEVVATPRSNRSRGTGRVERCMDPGGNQ